MKTKIKLLTLVFALGAAGASAQNSVPSVENAGVATATPAPIPKADPSMSPAEARSSLAAQVQRAIAVMGGEGWAAVGAATAKTSIADPRQPAITTTRSHDWSGHAGVGRMDMSGSKGSRTVVETSSMRYFPNNPKGWQVALPNFDLSSLAVRYPAAALRLALQRNCEFSTRRETPLTPADDRGALAMECIAPTYPNRQAKLLWWFDTAGLVRKVSVPYLSGGGRYVTYETVYFDQYRQIQGLQVPVTLRTVHMGGLVSTETVGSVSFQASMPAATFQISTQK